MSLFDTLKNKKLITSNCFKITHLDLEWNTLDVAIQNENITYSISSTSEYTYIMEDPSTKQYKIGRTKNNPLERLRTFNTGNPSIKLVTVFPSEYYSEATLHAMFKDSLVIDAGTAKEWFFQTASLKSFIESEILKTQQILNCYKQFCQLKNEEAKLFNL